MSDFVLVTIVGRQWEGTWQSAVGYIVLIFVCGFVGRGVAFT